MPRLNRLHWIAPLLAASLWACDDNGGASSSTDTETDMGADTTDVGADTSPDLADASPDALPDTGLDVSPDASPDVAPDAAIDMPDAGTDDTPFAFSDPIGFPITDDDVMDAAAGDFDGDGYPDFVLSSVNHDDPERPAAGSRLYVLHNEYEATGAWNADLFAEPIILTGGRFYGVAAGDIDGNGADDIVAFSDANEVLVFTYTGDGSTFAADDFMMTTATAAHTNAHQGSTVADVNGDGLPDVIAVDASVLGSGSSGVSILINTSVPGDVAFAPAVSVGAGGIFPTGVAVGDYDGDGANDIIVGGVEDGGDWTALGIVWGTLDGANWTPGTIDWITAPETSNIDEDYRDIVTLDANGDAIDDFAVVRRGLSSNIWGIGVFVGNGARSFDEPVASNFFGGDMEMVLALAADGAGSDDVLGFDTFGSGVTGRRTNMYPFLNEAPGDGSFAAEDLVRDNDLRVETSPGYFRPVLADIDGDGALDLGGAARTFGQRVTSDDGGQLTVQRNETPQR